MFILPCQLIVSDLKSRKLLGKIRAVFGETDPQLYRFCQAVESSNEFVQKISRRHYCLYISPSHLIPCTEQRWSKYYKHMVFPKNYSSIIVFNKNMKAMVPLSDDDTDFCDTVVGVLQGETLAPHT